jgi:hypothetical protein
MYAHTGSRLHRPRSDTLRAPCLGTGSAPITPTIWASASEMRAPDLRARHHQFADTETAAVEMTAKNGEKECRTSMTEQAVDDNPGGRIVVLRVVMATVLFGTFAAAMACGGDLLGGDTLSDEASWSIGYEAGQRLRSRGATATQANCEQQLDEEQHRREQRGLTAPGEPAYITACVRGEPY